MDAALVFAACALLCAGTKEQLLACAFDAVLWNAGMLLRSRAQPNALTPQVKSTQLMFPPVYQSVGEFASPCSNRVGIQES